MKFFLSFLAMSLVLTAQSAQAEFFEDLGKQLSLLSCDQEKQQVVQSVVLNKDPNQNQIWSFKKDNKTGQLVYDANPANWYTIYNKEDLQLFCRQARFERYAQLRGLEVEPFVTRKYFCGMYLYACDVHPRRGDKNNSVKSERPDNSNDPDNPGNDNPDGNGNNGSGGNGSGGNNGDGGNGGNGDNGNGGGVPDNF